MPRQNLYKLIERTVIQQTYLPLSGLGSNASLVHPIRRIPAKFRKFSLDAPCLLVEALIYIMARRYSVSSLLFFSFLPPPPPPSVRQSSLFVLVHRKERRGWLASKGTERNSRKEKDSKSMPGFTRFLSLSLPFTLFVSSLLGERRHVSRLLHFSSLSGLPNTTRRPWEILPMLKNRLRASRSDRTAIIFTLLARLFPYFLCLATSLANRRSILASMRRSRAPTSFPMVRFFLAKDTYTELSTLVSNFSARFHASLLYRKKEHLSLSSVTSLSFFTERITFIKYRTEC